MNFILIVSDTFRRDHLGCYGNRWISTPHLDAFARAAQVFENAYSASFPTVPNRRDVMTGCFTAAYTGWAPMTEKETVISQLLSDAGYATAMVTDCPHILENGYYFDKGFQSWEWIRGQESDRWKTHPRHPESPCDPKKIRNAARLSQRHRRAAAARRYESDTFVAQTMTRACEWLEDNYRDGPFFLYVDTFDPHEPWDAPQWYVERYNPGYTAEAVDYPHYAFVKGYLSPKELDHCRALYAAEVTLVDRWAGRLLQKIGDLNLLDDTLVIFTTDHGFLLGEHGIIGKGLIPEDRLRYIPLYEEISHIPFILHLPGGTAGRRKAVVQPQDILPTILELAQLPIPKTVNGRSFARVIKGGPDRHRDFAVSAPFIGMETVFATVWKDRWAAMLRPGKRPAGAKQADKAIDGYAKLERAGGLAGEMLFDMAGDPQQQKNLVREHPGLMAELRADLLSYFESAHADEKLIEAWRKPPAKKKDSAATYQRK
jgi:arylsulfatase A-like enzyme